MSSHWRVDPDQPYRYACPDCDSRSLERNVRTGPYCHNCNERKTYVIDKKDNVQVIDP